MLGDELLHHPNGSRVLDDEHIDAPRAKPFLFAAKRLALADHDARNAVQHDRARTHGARRKRRVHRALAIDRGGLTAGALERVHFSMQHRAALLDPSIVAAPDDSTA